MPSFEKLAIFSSALALSTSALFRKGVTQPASTLFGSLQANPDAKNTAGAAIGSENQVLWTIRTQSYFDEDLAIEYVDFINELTMPILATDIITFHVEFLSSRTTTLARDGFDCKLSKDSSTSYWITEDPVDYHVLSADPDTAVEDFNNSIPTDGQDWYVSKQDSQRSSHLCSKDPNSVYQCLKIKCIVRRTFDTQDSYDMLLGPDGAIDNTLTFAAGKSYIRLNQVDEADPHWLQTTTELTGVLVEEGSIENAIVSTVALTATLASLALF